MRLLLTLQNRIMKHLLTLLISLSVAATLTACESSIKTNTGTEPETNTGLKPETNPAKTPVIDSLNPIEKAVLQAELQTQLYCTYDGAYRGMSYPGGDIERSKGVCTDVLIRSLRAADIDLQQLIHEDMKRDLAPYYARYHTKSIDKNIDHRRTQNIQTYLTSMHAKLDISNMSPEDFKIGDIIFWDIAAGHTGIVVESMNADKTTHLVVHNIGRGPEYEDLLTYWPPIDAYRLQEVTIKKMQADCSYKHDFKSDPYFTNPGALDHYAKK